MKGCQLSVVRGPLFPHLRRMTAPRQRVLVLNTEPGAVATALTYGNLHVDSYEVSRLVDVTPKKTVS